MSIPKQELKSIHIQKLKGLNNLDMSFEGHNLTAIMGVNGCGKTTILYAIACCYQPYDENRSNNYIFSQYFTPNTDSKWAGSKFTIKYEHDLASPRYRNERIYKKDNDRWSPRYKTRLQRWVSYIGVKDSVPVIETLKTKSFIRIIKRVKNDNVSRHILAAASYVLNRQYTILSSNEIRRENIIGVKYDNIEYSAISMGSGEQRVFKIFEQAYLAPEYGLLLIDEIELLMHPDALKRVIKKLIEIANEKKLQIIFTTHSDLILNFKSLINIRHIYIADNKNAYCFNDTNPKLLYQLTGNQAKKLRLFVEDELSKQIVFKIAGQVGIRQFVKIDTFGPAINCFTTAAGAVLNGLDISNSLFIIDGDVYRTREDKKERIQEVITGKDYQSRRKQVKALQAIMEFSLKNFSILK
jgi:AAA15 family ATPase/GTPase